MVSPSVVPDRGSHQSSRSGLAASVAAAGAANLSLLLTSLVRTKIVAVQLGAAGSGVMAQLSTVVTLSAAVASLGMANAGIREIAAAHAADDRAMFRKVTFTLLAIPALLAVTVLPILLLAGPALSRLLLGNGQPASYVAIAVAAVPLTLAGSAVTVVHQGLRRMQRLAIASLVSSIAGIAVTIPLTVGWGLTGAVWSLPVAALTSLMVLGLSGRGLIGRLTPLRLIDSNTARRFLTIGAASLLALSLTLGGDLVVRTIVVHRLGTAANGLYQPVYVISTSGFAQVGNALATVLLAALSGYVASRDTAGLRAILDKAMRSAVVVMVPLVLVTMALRGPILTILASRSFSSAGDILALQVVGELPRIAAYTAGAALLPQGRVVEWLTAGASASVVRIGVCLALLPSLGLMALAWSYVIEWTAVCLLTYAFTRRVGPAPETRTWLLALGGVILTGIAAFVVIHTHPVVGGCVAALLGLTWTVVFARQLPDPRALLRREA